MSSTKDSSDSSSHELVQSRLQKFQETNNSFDRVRNEPVDYHSDGEGVESIQDKMQRLQQCGMSGTKPKPMKITCTSHSVMKDNEENPTIVLESRPDKMNVSAMENNEKVKLQPLSKVILSSHLNDEVESKTETFVSETVASLNKNLNPKNSKKETWSSFLPTSSVVTEDVLLGRSFVREPQDCEKPSIENAAIQAPLIVINAESSVVDYQVLSDLDNQCKSIAGETVNAISSKGSYENLTENMKSLQNSNEDFNNITLDKVAESGNVDDENEDIDSDFPLPPPHINFTDTVPPQTHIDTPAPPPTSNIIEEGNDKMCVADGSAEDRITRLISKYCLADGKCSLWCWKGVKWIRCFLSYKPKDVCLLLLCGIKKKLSIAMLKYCCSENFRCIGEP